jgi:hypothetical protein
MLVHPEQGARVPVSGPAAKAIGFSGEAEETGEGKCCEKKDAFSPLPPSH